MNRMPHYVFEETYVRDGTVEIRAALEAAALAVCESCKYYRARTIRAGKRAPPFYAEGTLPATREGKRRATQKLVRNLLASSGPHGVFELMLGDAPIPGTHPAKFDHSGESRSWVLNLSKKEFSALKAGLEKAGLPRDLFYEAGEGRCFPYPGDGILAKAMRFAGVKKCFTPRELRAMGKAKPAAKRK
jgi:hypothetical protein